MYGYIYLTTNLINGKIYVGQHISLSFDEKYAGSGTILQKAFKKYGRENFSTEILYECNSQEELDEKEMYYIELMQSTDSNIGYNIKLGGGNSPCADSVKKKISEIEKANPNRAMLGRKHTQETRDLMSQKAIGRKKSQQMRDKMSIALQGNTNNGGCNRGKRWVTNHTEQYLVTEDEIDKYLKQGFVLGRLPRTDEEKEQLRNLYATRLFIHKDNEERWVDTTLAYSMLDDGWIIGKLPRDTSIKGSKISASKKGKIKILKKDSIKYIDEKDFVEYEKLGYQRSKKNTL